MKQRALLGAALLAVVAGALAPAPARAAELGVVSDLNWGISAADQARTVDELRSLGAKWVRLHVSWKDFEQMKGSYNQWNLGATGTSIDQARAAGAKVVLMVYEAPAWASGSTSSNVPRNAADFASFMGHLASVYRGKVAAYEIWNEQNYARFWSTGPDPAAYAGLLQAAYPAIKAADPEALVVYGGLSTNDWQFLEATYRAGVRGSFDVLATHPYPDCGGSPDTIRRDGSGRMTRGTFLAYRELRASMLAAGDAKPIWFTELGWSTATTACNPGAGVWQGGVTEQTQTDYLRRAFELVSFDPYVQAALVYNFRNNFFSRDADDIEARMGILRSDFTRKPAFYALQGLAGGAPAPAPAPEPAPAPAPNQPPLVTSLTAPSTFWGRLAIRATATDDKGVALVRFYVGSTLVAADRTPPYETTWKVPKSLSPGSHSVTAVAVDAQTAEARRSVSVTRAR